MVGLKICEDEYFDEKRQEYVIESFEFSNGKVLENVNVEYMTFGTPKYDDDIITNAIIYCHGSLGNFTGVKKIFPLIHDGAPFDEKKYFFISMSALGSPGSCSPSSTDLNTPRNATSVLPKPTSPQRSLSIGISFCISFLISSID
jgi:homoserine O-acetyltransferase